MPIILTRPTKSSPQQPSFLSATILPEKGMQLLQIRAFLPDIGETDLLYSPNLTAAEQLLNTDQNNAFKMGSALLLPYANRIRGKLLANQDRIQTTIANHDVILPANWQGKKPSAEKHAMHGLMLASKFEQTQFYNRKNSSLIASLLHANNFNGHWPSQTDINIAVTLTDHKLTITITTKNVGIELLPMGIGAHPYFVFPSGDRKQVRLHIPGTIRALVNNYDDVFPTGELAPVKNTCFDFTAPQGKELADLYLDDSFTSLSKTNGTSVISLHDAAANYHLRITTLSPEIKVIHVYAPTDKNFIAIEPQFNLADPYADVWNGVDTGMVLLKPRETVTWQISLELF